MICIRRQTNREGSGDNIRDERIKQRGTLYYICEYVTSKLKQSEGIHTMEGIKRGRVVYSY